MNNLENENRELRRAITDAFYSLFGPGMNYSDKAYNILVEHVDDERLKELRVQYEEERQEWMRQEVEQGSYWRNQNESPVEMSADDYRDLLGRGWEIDELP